jgi:hypothetical protein
VKARKSERFRYPITRRRWECDAGHKKQRKHNLSKRSFIELAVKGRAKRLCERGNTDHKETHSLERDGASSMQ